MKTIILLLLIVVAMGCRKPYNPPVTSSQVSYLVVEGVIDPGSDETDIKLSRTVPLSSSTVLNPELGATVSVVSDQNTTIPLAEADSGNYRGTGLNLDPAHKYGLLIKTADNREYYSDFEPVISTPPIDSVGFNIVSSEGQTGIQLYANTHDAENGARYYLWNYDEEWRFYTKYVSSYVSSGDALVARLPSQDITFCFAGGPSSVIILGSSAKLSKNVIYQNPLLFIPSTSEKIEERYSILVQQYALTGEAYAFYTNLKKNTENLGSIFDAQPSSSPGNLHCRSNPNELVIGYVSVSTVSKKRIFIDKTQLPQWIPTYPYTCQQDTAGAGSGVSIQDLIDFPDVFLATYATFKNSLVSGYLYTSRECADCTIRGTVTAPSYWK